MARGKLSLPMIRRVARALPDVEEGTSYRTPAWRHRGKLLARLHQDGCSIVLKVGDQTRDPSDYVRTGASLLATGHRPHPGAGGCVRSSR